MGRLIDLTGETFGRLRVLGRAEDYTAPGGHKAVAWHCLCRCGKEVDVLSSNLRRYRTTSCGCYRAETSTTAYARHLLKRK